MLSMQLWVKFGKLIFGKFIFTCIIPILVYFDVFYGPRLTGDRPFQYEELFTGLGLLSLRLDPGHAKR